MHVRTAVRAAAAERTERDETTGRRSLDQLGGRGIVCTARTPRRRNPAVFIRFFSFITGTIIFTFRQHSGGLVAEWLALGTQAQKARVQIAAATLSGNSLRQTVHTHCASVHQAAKLVAALLRVAWVTAGLAESNGSLLPSL